MKMFLKELSGIEPASSFELKIDFEKHSDRPSRVFQSMAQMIDSFQVIDNDLLVPFGIRAQSFLVLEDIKAGSLRTILTTMLQSVDDEALKACDHKKIIGNYLLKAKYVLIKFLEKKNQITERSELTKLGDTLHALAKKTEVKRLAAYKPVPLILLIRDIGSVTSALTPLKPADTSKLITNNEEVQFNQSFQYHQDSMENLLTKEVISSTKSEILKVKKPDYLGVSMWEFRFHNRIIFAKIEDHDWLLEFQSRQKDVRPGDALEVLLRTDVSYGFHGEEIVIHYRILEIEKIIPLAALEQGRLLP